MPEENVCDVGGWGGWLGLGLGQGPKQPPLPRGSLSNGLVPLQGALRCRRGRPLCTAHLVPVGDYEDWVAARPMDPVHAEGVPPKGVGDADMMRRESVETVGAKGPSRSDLGARDVERDCRCRSHTPFPCRFPLHCEAPSVWGTAGALVWPRKAYVPRRSSYVRLDSLLTKEPALPLRLLCLFGGCRTFG